mmetsp:Transcript_55257/g.120378  ORF Transcript_55257/g.120378 Transcript_55257/m.120378 type:complete len:200 (-) Transcript_55257:526-1125(-)
MRGLRGGGHLCDDAMVARVHDGGCHLRDAEGDSLSLGCHHHDLLTHLQWNEETGAQGGNLDAVFEAKQTGDHELGAVADGVDGAVLGDHALVPDQETLQRHDDAAKVRLVLGVVVQVLRVHDIVHGDQVGSLIEGTGADAAELLHVSSDAKQQPQVHTHGSHVGSGLTANPKYCHVSFVVKLEQFGLVDGANTERPLHG